MIGPNLPGLSVRKQCALLSISRSSFYYEPKGETEMNLDLMRVIDKQFLETPFYGVRQMTCALSGAYSATHSDSIWPPKPEYPATCGALR